MGRPRQNRTTSQARFAKARSKKRPRIPAITTSTEEFDDDIDKFHKGAEKIYLDVNEDIELSDDGDAEEPVLNLNAESNSDDNDEDSDDDDLDEEELSGLVAKMTKQSKMLRQNRTLIDSDEEDQIDDDQELTDKKAAWGKRKRTYYDADTADYELFSSDEEAPVEEEIEALRLQRQMAERLRPEDFDLDVEDYQKSSKDDENSLQEIVAKTEADGDLQNDNQLLKRGRGLNLNGSLLIEEIKKDASALSKEEQMNVVMSDAPELVGLLKELRESSHDLYNKIEPLLLKVRSFGNANKGGLSFLEAKRVLVLAYIQSILFYLLMKADGHPVRDHPVIARLVEIRTLLQKLHPFEKKLRNQIDQLLTVSNDATSELKGTVQEEKQSTQLQSLLLWPDNAQASVTSNRVGLKDGPPAEVVSGDMDFPLKEDLGARRAKLERQTRPYVDDADNFQDGFEDEFYQQAKQLKESKKAAKKKDPSRIAIPEPTIEADVGKRQITYQMEKNRGLTPYRKKLTKNPRKKYKLKHQNAVIRRKGQVRDIKRPSGPYGGEATGIRTAISRSVRFSN